MQTKRQSLLETCLSTAAGFAVAVAMQILIFPLYGIEATVNQNLQIGVWFTAASIARGYLIRRLFNHLHKAQK